MYKNDLSMLRRHDISLFRECDPCSVGLIDLLRIRAYQRVYVVKLVGSNLSL